MHGFGGVICFYVYGDKHKTVLCHLFTLSFFLLSLDDGHTSKVTNFATYAIFSICFKLTFGLLASNPRVLVHCDVCFFSTECLIYIILTFCTWKPNEINFSIGKCITSSGNLDRKHYIETNLCNEVYILWLWSTSNGAFDGKIAPKTLCKRVNWYQNGISGISRGIECLYVVLLCHWLVHPRSMSFGNYIESLYINIFTLSQGSNLFADNIFSNKYFKLRLCGKVKWSKYSPIFIFFTFTLNIKYPIIFAKM